MFLEEAFTEKAEDLSEQAIAGYGDWSPSRNRILQKSLKQLNAEFIKVDTVRISKEFTLDLYKMKDMNVFILGQMADDSFDTVFHIEFNERKDIERLIGNPEYNKLMNVDGVIVEKTMRGYGIAKTMYKYFVKNLKFTILGDEIQYHKARLTWASLSKMDDVIVDIFNITTGEILERNVKLHHGVEDHDHDERVWDYTNRLEDIRLLLREVK